MECDFEADFCNYIPSFEFERSNEKAPGYLSGPPYDQTTGSGYYALCKSESLVNEKTCQLNKTFINTNEEFDFTFWY